MSTVIDCLNCGLNLDESSNFCKNCGQKSDQHRLNLHHLLHEAVHFLTHADKGIFFLIKQLVAKPGIVAQEYIRGRRKKYFSPLTFFLLAVGLFLFVQTTFHPMQGGINLSAIKKDVMEIGNPVVRERRLMKLERREEAINFMAKYSNIINFVITPLIALLFFIFFFKSGYNYTEHLITNMYMAGFSCLVFVAIITPYTLLTQRSPLYFLGIIGFLLFEVLYRSIGYYQLTNSKGTRHYLYCLFVSAITVTGWSGLSTGLMSVYIDTGFKFLSFN